MRSTRRIVPGVDPMEPRALLSGGIAPPNAAVLADLARIQADQATLQADLNLPLDLRPDANDNSSLTPVLGGLDTVLTNISALSPDYDPAATQENGARVARARSSICSPSCSLVA